MEFCGPSVTQMTGLRYVGLQKRTVRAYRLASKLYFEYLEHEHLEIPTTYHELDNSLARYIETMYLDDRPVTYAGHLLSALKRFYPRVRHQIPLAKQHLVNWKTSQRTAPSCSYACPGVHESCLFGFRCKRSPACCVIAT